MAEMWNDAVAMPSTSETVSMHAPRRMRVCSLWKAMDAVLLSVTR